MKSSRLVSTIFLLITTLGTALAQQVSKHILSSEELTKVVPAEYFFRGQKAPVQLRNAVGSQLADGRVTLAALVDASGYSTAIQQKYQGLLINESKLNIVGADLVPGQYGFGFVGNKFVVCDVSAAELLSVASRTDQAMQRAVPLKLVEDGAGYRLYVGKNWVEIRSE